MSLIRNRTFWLIIILLVIVSGIYLTVRDTDEISSLSASERSFALDPGTTISRIEIVDHTRKRTILTHEKSSWMVGENYPARKNAIDNLLEVIYGLRIQYIPPPVSEKNIFRDIRAIGVQVEIYGEGNQLLRSYWIGGVTQDERGTYMLAEGAERPYVMHLPNLEGSVRGRFLMKETDWRDRTVLNEDRDEIVRIMVDYKKDRSESFSLIRSNGRFVLEPLHQSIAKNPSNANQNLIENYVAGYNSLVAEYIDNDNPRRDSIRSLVPFVEITLENITTQTKMIRFYPLEELLYEDQNTSSLESKHQVRRYFVDCSWGDFMLVQHRLAGKLLRGYSYFFPDEANIE